MARLRHYPANTTHSIMRRTAGRRYFLVASPFIKQLFFYLLGYGQQQHDSILLHGFCALSTHYHKQLTDTHTAEEVSDLSNYMRGFNSLSARAINVSLGRGENLWRVGQYNNVLTKGLTAIERQWLYVATQAVRAGMVRWPEDYPGPWIPPEWFGTTRTIKRPDGALFGGWREKKPEPSEIEDVLDLCGHQDLADQEAAALKLLGGTNVPDPTKPAKKKRNRKAPTKKREAQLAKERLQRAANKAKAEAPKGTRKPRVRTCLPDSVELRVDPPPGFEHLGLEGTIKHFRSLLDHEVALIHAERKARGKDRYLGAKRIQSQSPFKRSGTTWPTFERIPTVACKDPLLLAQTLVHLQGFRQDHTVAVGAWRRLNRNAIFPAGTVGMVLNHNARFRGGPKTDAERKDGPPLPRSERRRRRDRALPPPKTEPPGP